MWWIPSHGWTSPRNLSMDRQIFIGHNKGRPISFLSSCCLKIVPRIYHEVRRTLILSCSVSRWTIARLVLQGSIWSPCICRSLSLIVVHCNYLHSLLVLPDMIIWVACSVVWPDCWGDELRWHNGQANGFDKRRIRKAPMMVSFGRCQYTRNSVDHRLELLDSIFKSNLNVLH